MSPSHRALARRPALALATALTVALSLLTGAATAAAAGEVKISFVEPDKYTDAGRSVVDRERTTQALGDYLRSLGGELPEGQTLEIEVLDIDRAGSIEPFARTHYNELRVLRGTADWPRVQLRYRLLAEGRTLKSGEVKLADLDYMNSLRGRDRGPDELTYERRLLRRWFDETFAAR